VTKLEAVLSFIDLITILTRNNLCFRLILQMAISVIRTVLPHFRPKFNQIQQELTGLRIIGGFFRSAVVSTASVGVPPAEPIVRNRPAYLVSSQAHR
jgi:hypothetical protein